jgi:hypothetical protein
MLDITVVIPTIAPRSKLLEQAITSVQRQRLLPVNLLVSRDQYHDGAAATRAKGVEQVESDWTAFLDDDDMMLPWHLEALAAAQHLTGADYVFSYYTVMDDRGGLHPENDPLGHFGRVFDPVNPTQTTITILVRTELAKLYPFHDATTDVPAGSDGKRLNSGEDWAFTLDCVEAGAKIVHVPMRTWLWRHHAANTSGLPEAW